MSIILIPQKMYYHFLDVSIELLTTFVLPNRRYNIGNYIVFIY